MKTALITLAALTSLFALIWFAQGSDFFIYSVFAPKYEAVRRQTFEQTKSYNEGVAQELRSAQLDYARAKTSAEKQALASYVLHQTAGYDVSRLPPDLQSFINQLSVEVSQ